jgi:alkaline phosphatase D
MASSGLVPLLVLLLVVPSLGARAPPNATAVVSRIAFGSCANQSAPQVLDGTPIVSPALDLLRFA